jgi:hypothetical protein
MKRLHRFPVLLMLLLLFSFYRTNLSKSSLLLHVRVICIPPDGNNLFDFAWRRMAWLGDVSPKPLQHQPLSEQYCYDHILPASSNSIIEAIAIYQSFYGPVVAETR